MASPPPFLNDRRRRRSDLGPVLLLLGLVALVVAMLPSSFYEEESEALTARLPAVAAAVTGSEPEAAPRADAVAVPQRVWIPRIGLRERLTHLGLGERGQMEVPEDPDRVGWFSASGMPSTGLPLVIAGHVDSTTGPAVFARLSELERGDKVVVTTDAGRRRYVVTGVRSVPQDAFPTRQVFGATRHDTLRLITCTGLYDHGIGRYTRNLVVTARRA